MNIVIPDTNVILAASFDTIYDGTIPIRHTFHDESFQLLNKVNYEHNGILLPKVKEECIDKYASTFQNLHTVAVARQIVKKVATEAVKKLAREGTGNATEVRKLQKDYFQIIVKDHHLSHPRDIESKDLGHEIPIEITYLRDLYSVLPVTYIDWKEIKQEHLSYRIEFVLQCALKEVERYRKGKKLSSYRENLWFEIKCEIKNMRLNHSSTKNADLNCLAQMRK